MQSRAHHDSKYAIKGLADGLRSELLATPCKVHLFAPANMDTPGFARENESKPDITASIEGTASTVTSRQAARSLLGGILRNRYIICNDLLGELVRVTVHGPSPRPNAFVEILALPLISGIFVVWSWFTDVTIKGYFKKSRSGGKSH